MFDMAKYRKTNFFCSPYISVIVFNSIHLEMDKKNLGTFYRDFQAKVPYIQKTSNFVVEVSIVGEDRKDWSKVLRPRKNEGINM